MNKFGLAVCALFLGLSMTAGAQTPEDNYAVDRSKPPAIGAPDPVKIPPVIMLMYGKEASNRKQ